MGSAFYKVFIGQCLFFVTMSAWFCHDNGKRGLVVNIITLLGGEGEKSVLKGKEEICCVIIYRVFAA